MKKMPKKSSLTSKSAPKKFIRKTKSTNILGLVVAIICLLGLAIGVYVANRPEQVMSQPEAVAVDVFNTPYGDERHSPRYLNVKASGITLALPNLDMVPILDLSQLKSYEATFPYDDVGSDVRQALTNQKLDFIRYEQQTKDSSGNNVQVSLIFTVDYQNKLWWLSNVSTTYTSPGASITGVRGQAPIINGIWYQTNTSRDGKNPTNNAEAAKQKLTPAIPFNQPLSRDRLDLPMYIFTPPGKYESNQYSTISFANLTVTLFAQNNPYGNAGAPTQPSSIKNPTQPVTQRNLPPIGTFDLADSSNCTIAGWSGDPDAVGHSIDVHVYLDAPAGGGNYPKYENFMGSFKADKPRQDVNDFYKVPGNYGFVIDLKNNPKMPKDGKPHSIYIYGINANGGPNAILAGTPKLLTCGPRGRLNDQREQ